MSQVLSDKDCFVCEKAGFKGIKVDLEKVGTKPDGKAIWKPYQAGTNLEIEHQHKGQETKVSNAQLDAKLDKILTLLNEIRGQKQL